MSNYPFEKDITSVSDLEKIIKQVQEYRGPFTITELYRGQGRDCWKLIPKIARVFGDSEIIKEKEKAIISEFFGLLKKEELINNISKGLEPNRGKFESEWLLLQQAQHYEVPTRFLDWSGRWEASLCFAVADESDDRFDGQFWIALVPDNIWVSDNGESNYLNEDPFKYDQTIFLNSANIGSKNSLIQIALRRKGTQMGRFCIQLYSKITIPLEEQDEYKKYLHKIIIPAKFKKNIREELAFQGITKEALYVSESFNKLENEQHKETIEKITKIAKGLTLKYGL